MTDQPACAGRYDLYESADQGSRWATAECMRLCREVCPIQAACLESTLTYEKVRGHDAIQLIAGGMLPAQRAALLGKRYHHQKATGILPVQMLDSGLPRTSEKAKGK